MKLIADTGFILARWSKSQARRAWAVRYLENAELPFLTAEANLLEAGWRLGRPELAPRLLKDGDYISKLAISEHAGELLWLVNKYADREMDIADTCIVRLAELNPDATILTTDKADFSVYRTRAGAKLRCDFGPD